MWFAPWPLNGVLVLVLAAVGVGAIVVRGRLRRPSIPFLDETFEADLPDAPLLKTEPRQERVTRVLLPSAREDYCFLFSATVRWSLISVQDEMVIDLPALAINTILRRARTIAALQEPGSASLARHELAAHLGEMQPDPTGRLQAMATSIELSLPEHDQERLDKLATVRKEKAVWEHERKEEQSKREYLGDDVLRDPASAVIWWLARNDGQVDKTVQDLPLLTTLSSAVNDIGLTDLPFTAGTDFNGARKSAGDIFNDFLHAMDFAEDDPQRDMFAHQVADLADEHGRPEIAAELKQRFEPPPDERPEESATGGASE
jgi:hypothetical protein